MGLWSSWETTSGPTGLKLLLAGKRLEVVISRGHLMVGTEGGEKKGPCS